MNTEDIPSYWCWTPQSEMVLKDLSDYDLHYIIKTHQIELYTLLFIHVPTLMLWSVATWGKGFGNLYDGSGLNAVSHVWFYLAWEMWIVCWGFFSTGFTFWVARDGRLQKDSYSVRWRLKAWIVFLVLGIAVHIWHMVALGYEIDTCDSTLCVSNKGVMWALMIGLGVLIVLEAVEIYRAYAFHHHMYLIAKLQPSVFNEQYVPETPLATPPTMQAAPAASLIRYSIPMGIKMSAKPSYSHGLKKNRSE